MVINLLYCRSTGTMPYKQMCYFACKMHLIHSNIAQFVSIALKKDTRLYLCILQAPIKHKHLEPILNPILELNEDVRRKALTRLSFEKLIKCDDIAKPTGRYYDNPEGYAMGRYCYYQCFKCQKVSNFYIISDLNIPWHDSFAPVFQWCCSTPQRSPGVGRHTLFLSSPHLCFIIE